MAVMHWTFLAGRPDDTVRSELIERPNRLDYANVTFWSPISVCLRVALASRFLFKARCWPHQRQYGIGAYGARVFDRSLSGHCHLYTMCNRLAGYHEGERYARSQLPVLVSVILQW